jgi:hypothetical protein
MSEPTYPLMQAAPVPEAGRALLTPAGIGIPEAPVREDADLVTTVQKLSGKFPEVDTNLITCLVQELQQMTGYRKEPTADSAVIITMAPAILAGKYSMQEIVAHLGYNYKEFRSDIKRAYGDFSQLKNAGITEFSIQNMFRAKYGLDISPAAIATCGDDEIYWRTKLAYAVSKLETNRIEVGDDVMVMTDDRNFGKVGTIMNLTDNEAEILEDGIANLPLAVTQPLVHLRLLSGPEKKASLRLGEDKSLKLQSSYYPAGLQSAAITSWYKAVGYEAYKRLAGLDPVTYHRTLGSTLTCEHRNYTGDFANDVNADNLTAIAGRIPNYTKTVAIRITPTAGASDSTARYVVSAIMDDLAVSQGVEDIQVRFSGSNGYYLLATFTTADYREYQQERCRSAVAAYIESTPRHNYTLGETLEPNRISIVTNIQMVPAAYSVDMTTGLVAMPLDPVKLEGFNPSQATITQLSDIYELGIAA